MPTWIIALLKWGGIAPAVIGGAARVRAPGRCRKMKAEMVHAARRTSGETANDR
ncbi:MAG: hypothetical protein V3R55_00380 [Alphaproteobacteria bacterium]